MNVLRVIGSMKPSTGGPCQGIRNAIPELEKLGILNEVVSLDDPADLVPGQDPFPVHPLGPIKGPWCYTAKLNPWLLRNFARFDVVIVHGLWLYHSYAVMKSLRKFKDQVLAGQQEGKTPRCFVMPHGMLDPYFQRAPERRLKAIRNSLYWKVFEARVIKEADGLLFTCEEELQLARQPFRPYKPKQEINVGYGIDEPPSFTPAMLQVFQEKCPGLGEYPYLLFLSRIHKKKGVDLLIQAYSSLIEQLKQKSGQVPRLVIAGPGLDTAYGKEIQQLVQGKPHLRSHVFFPGMLSGDAKWGAFYRCEAFVLPSHQENFGIAVVEALACRKPVLISRQVNICSKIISYGGGLVEDDTLEGTQGLLKSFFNLSDEEKRAVGKKAHDLYQQNFAIGPVARQFMQALHK